jgi:hypothetical protein
MKDVRILCKNTTTVLFKFLVGQELLLLYNYLYHKREHYKLCEILPITDLKFFRPKEYNFNKIFSIVFPYIYHVK